MGYRQFQPAPALQPYIESYWSLQDIYPARETIRLFPDGCVDLILNLGEEFHSVKRDFVISHENTYLIGLMTSFREHFLPGTTHLFGIRFKPGAFGCFYQYEPMHCLSNRVNEFERDLFPDIQKLIRYKLPYLDQFFLDRLSAPRHHRQAIIADILANKGLIKVDALTKRHFITARQLERFFQYQVGLAPKAFINLIRFNHTMDRIRNRANDPQSLLQIAFDCGYYDHAHLANDVKAYTGLTPSELILSDFSKTAA